VSFLHVSRPEIDLPEGIDEHSDEVYAQGARNLDGPHRGRRLVADPEPRLYLYAQRHGRSPAGRRGRLRLGRGVRPRPHQEAREDARRQGGRPHAPHRGARAPTTSPSSSRTARPGDRRDRPRGHQGAIARLRLHDRRRRATHSGSSAATTRPASSGRASRRAVLYVADGHHRSAAASRVHKALRGDGGRARRVPRRRLPARPDEDPPVQPRRARPQGRSPEALLAAVARAPRRRAPESGAAAAPRAPKTFGSTSRASGTGPASARARTTRATPSSLDCSICQDQILGPDVRRDRPAARQARRLRGRHPRRAELERRVDSGEMTWPCTCSRRRSSELLAVSDAGLLMPPKSTLVRAQAPQRPLRAHGF
jgi:hypothetical protein